MNALRLSRRDVGFRGQTHMVTWSPETSTAVFAADDFMDGRIPQRGEQMSIAGRNTGIVRSAAIIGASVSVGIIVMR